MTEISDQLRSARQVYRCARYPGDLANDLLPPRSVPRPMRWALVSGVGAGIAAAVLLSLFLTRMADVPQPDPVRHSDGGWADVLPIAPGRVPLPRFEAPALPVRPPEIRLPVDVPRGVEAYQDLAMQYRQLQLDEQLRRTTVPSIPVDLPTRGVEWLQKVWQGDKSA